MPSRSILGAAFLALAATLLPAQAPRAYRPGIDVLDYSFRIDLPDTGSTISGDAELVVRRSGRTDSLILDLRWLEVMLVRVDNRRVNFRRTDSTIAIPLPPGDSGHFRVRVAYGGAVTDGLIVRRDSAGRWTYFADNWPNRARFWIPTVDHPSDKATVTWRVNAPPNRTVVANGTLVRTSVSGRRVLTEWRESQPIATYLMVVAAAPLVRYDLGATACGLADLQKCVPQAVYTAPEQRSVVPGHFSEAGPIVKYFATTIGNFPYERLSHLQSATRFGGMENATAIFYSDAAFRRDSGVNEGTIAHEIAHQWFGDAVTEREWHDLWLSEGFATYFAALWTQRAHGDSAFKAQMARTRNAILASAVSAERPVIDTAQKDLMELLNTNSYQKGGFVLHMLRSQTGDKQFFGGLRYYFDTFKHGNATTSDLQDALERASGKKLGAFFDQWLRRPGFPEIGVRYVVDTASKRVDITVTQTGRFGFYEFPLGIAFIDRKGARRYYELAVTPSASSVIGIGYVGDGVERIEIDPDVKVLARINP